MADGREAIELMRGFFDKLRGAIDEYNADALRYLEGTRNEDALPAEEPVEESVEEPKAAKKPRKKAAAKKAEAVRNVPQEIRDWIAKRKAAGLRSVQYVRTALEELGITDATAVTEEQADDFLKRLEALVEEDA